MYGAGSISETKDRDGLYVGRIELGTGPDGKRLRKKVKGKTKDEVRKKLTAALAERDKGMPTAPATFTTGQWLTHWLDNVLPNADLSADTMRDYRYSATKYLIPALGKVPLVKLTPEHVERMMSRLRAKGTDTNPMVRTASYARSVLGTALGEAERRGRVVRNVARLAAAPKKPKVKLDDSLDADEAAMVLKTAQGDRLEALAVLVLAVGLRKGEALRLRWPDVDLDTEELTVRQAKTEAGVRTIALPGFAAEALRQHRRRQREERMAAPVWVDPELVFASEVGTPIDGRNALRWWHALTIRALGDGATVAGKGTCRHCAKPLTGRQRAWCSERCRRRHATHGTGRRRFHASRHTAATLMLNNGVPLEVVSKTLGHAGLAITADIYAKVRPELQRTAADAMERVLGGA